MAPAAPLEGRPRAVNTLEAARLLSISRPTLYKLLDAGEIASFRIGRSHRVPVDSIDAYIERQIAARAA